MVKDYAQNLVPVLQQHLDEAKILAGENAVAGRATNTGESTGSSTER
jgi:hypothetical protein